MWILAAAVAVLAVSTMYADSSGLLAERSWTKCKESFVAQMFSDQCTPRRGIALEPSTVAPGASGSDAPAASSSDGAPRMIPAPSDGIDKVDRGN
jgi:hypothetical protein